MKLHQTTIAGQHLSSGIEETDMAGMRAEARQGMKVVAWLLFLFGGMILGAWLVLNRL